MQLNPDAEREVWQLVERHGLHANLTLCLPVPIRQVATDEGWRLYYREGMGLLYGAAVVDGPVKLMTVNADIARPWQRHAIAHEMGHVINRDPSNIYTFNAPLWFGIRQERRASLVASKILIPTAALEEIASIEEIAAVCEVPHELVEVRLAAYENERPRHLFPFAAG